MAETLKLSFRGTSAELLNENGEYPFEFDVKADGNVELMIPVFLFPSKLVIEYSGIKIISHPDFGSQNLSPLLEFRLAEDQIMRGTLKISGAAEFKHPHPPLLNVSLTRMPHLSPEARIIKALSANPPMPGYH